MNDNPDILRSRLGSYRKIDQAILDGQPLESIASLAIDSLAGLIACNRVSIALLDESCETATVIAENRPTSAIRLATGQSISVFSFASMEQLRSGEPHQVVGVAGLDDGNPAKQYLLSLGINSYLVVPLVSHQGLIGMLNVGREGEEGFSRDEIETLRELGGQLALSICQAQLNQQNTQQKEELSTLLKISYTLARSLDLKEVLQTTIDESTQVMGLETGAIYLLSGEEIFLGATTPPLPPGFPQEFRIARLEHHPHIKHAMDSGHPIYLEDTQTADLTPQEKAVSVERGLRSLLYVPLQVSARNVGILIMGTIGHTRSFTNNEINLCRTFSAQMALAVENARLFQETHHQASEMERRVNERTAELEALTHAISHDLRAPLRAIQGFGQALIADHSEQLDQDGNLLLSRMVSASEKLEGMFDGLLSLTQVSSRIPLLEHLDMSAIAKKILIESCNEQPERQIEVNIHPCGDFCKKLFSDRIYAEILLTNLISNAIKFTQDKNPARIEFGCFTEADEGVYFLRDNGIGFNMDYAPQLFLPFQRLHSPEEFAGYGIGLTIVKKIIELHKGEIWMESKEGEGTTVFFKIKNLAPEGFKLSDLI